MLIGEMAEKSGLTRDTIRFYEKKGLITVVAEPRRNNNYKEYPDSVLERLLLIRKLKNMGFTLNEIAAFLQSWLQKDASCKSLTFTFEEKIAAVNKQLLTLREFKQHLLGSIAKCNTNNCEFEKAISSCC